MIETEDHLEGERVTLETTIQFRCHAGLACFNSCCRDKRLPLLPYDVLRLRRALARPSQGVLADHAEVEIDPVSGWPALRIRLREDGACPFLESAGCTVYEHRPTCCRIYPLARAVAPARSGAPRELFLVTRPRGCLGFDEDRHLSVSDWLEDQGLRPYHLVNNQSLRLFMHPNRRGALSLSSQQIHGVIMALYNLDVFREAVGKRGFAERFGLTPEAVAAALDSDEALLELGHDWLAAELFRR
jgi:hypothetical protein